MWNTTVNVELMEPVETSLDAFLSNRVNHRLAGPKQNAAKLLITIRKDQASRLSMF
jgi:hypothetical protein